MIFPVLAENPYKIDVDALLDVIDEERPELIIFGKSMVLHREPVWEIRTFSGSRSIEAVIMYDMAHVLGLVGTSLPGAVRRRGGPGHRLHPQDLLRDPAGRHRGPTGRKRRNGTPSGSPIERRTFPGSVSNHHLGTLLGLLMAAYEMNYFRDAYQQAVIRNAKAFAGALREAGLQVAGDPAIYFTETHQVVVKVE